MFELKREQITLESELEHLKIDVENTPEDISIKRSALIQAKSGLLKVNQEEWSYVEKRSSNLARISTFMEVGGILLIICGFSLWYVKTRKMYQFMECQRHNDQK
jgi:hypothetical protein